MWTERLGRFNPLPLVQGIDLAGMARGGPLLSVLSFLATVPLQGLPDPAVVASSELRRATWGREEILAAMTESRSFTPTATTNGARLQAEVLLRLASAGARGQRAATLPPVRGIARGRILSAPALRPIRHRSSSA